MRGSLCLLMVLAILFGSVLSCRPDGEQRVRSAGPAAGTSAEATGSSTVSPVAEVSPLTIERLAQLTIDNTRLAPFFHEKEIPARVPLVVLLNDVVRTSYNLTKFGRRVVFKPESVLAKDEPFFEITAILVEGATARVKFRYPPEGLLGTITFVKGPTEDWSVATTEIVER